MLRLAFIAAIAVAIITLHGCISDADRTVRDSVARASTRPADADANHANSAQEALRRFLVAVARRDELAVRQASLDRPGVKILWAVSSLDAEQEEKLVVFFSNVPLRPVKLGEVLRVPTQEGTRDLVINEHEVNDGRAMFLPKGSDIPFSVIRIDGVWRVDPGPLIAARNAAKAAAERQRGGKL